MNIVIVGPSGAGKSSTTNNLLEDMKRKANVGNTKNSCTKEVTRYESTLCGRRVNLLDTPGFNDTAGMTNEGIVAQILSEICSKTATKTVDCFLIADSLTSDRSSSGKTIEIIQKLFGDDAVRKVLVLMTKGESEIADEDEVDGI